MKTKFFFIATVFAASSFLFTQTSATDNKKIKTENMPYVSVPTTNNTYLCPVVGTGTQNSQDFSFASNEEGRLYIHCEKCNTGVYLPHDGGVEKCTFCGEPKK